jgi:CRP/FNR family transcriptional regulator, nitrogen fixation regulation protein
MQAQHPITTATAAPMTRAHHAAAQIAKAATAPTATDALDLLDQLGTAMRVGENGEIYAEGDPALYCYRVVSGLVRTVTLMEDGRRQISEFLMPGDLLGFDALDSHDNAAQAVGTVQLRRFPRPAVEALSEGNPAVARRLRQATAAKLREAHQQILLLGRKTASERIASFLLVMADRAGADTNGRIALPTRADMADHLGLTLETVSRTLNELHRAGMIKLARAMVEISDRPALAALALETRH